MGATAVKYIFTYSRNFEFDDLIYRPGIDSNRDGSPPKSH